jgi:hypothetical protein
MTPNKPLTVLLLLLGSFGFAQEAHNSSLDYAQVIFVRAVRSGRGLWRFDVTVRHRDEGWNHYANLWEVVDPKSDEVLGKRVLLHPHDNEQPFTRSQSGIRIPEELTHVVVRSQCTVHGFGGREVLVELRSGKSELYEVVLED